MNNVKMVNFCDPTISQARGILETIIDKVYYIVLRIRKVVVLK